MKYYPGDIILVKDIVFEKERMDHCPKGRPCLVLYAKDKNKSSEEIFFLILTSKLKYLRNYDFDNKYFPIDILSAPSLIDLSKIYQTNSTHASKPIGNITQELFNVINRTIDYHKFNKHPEIRNILDGLSVIRDYEESFTESVIKRADKINDQYNKVSKEPSPYEGINGYGKVHVKKYRNTYKYKKDLEKTFAISMNY